MHRNRLCAQRNGCAAIENCFVRSNKAQDGADLQCVLYSDGTRSRPVLLNLKRFNRKNRNTHYVVSSSFSAPWRNQEREWRRCRLTNRNVCRSARAHLRPGTWFLTFGRDTVPSHVNPRCEHECGSTWCIFSTDSFDCIRSLGS